MNYALIYNSLIESRKKLDRSKVDEYYENHHILPKCLGGLDESKNMVLLTPREHFIAHVLLWKIHNTRKLRDAVLYFKGKHNQFSKSRLYEKARILHIKEMKEKNPSTYLSSEALASKKQKLKNYIKTKEHRENISKAKRGLQPRLGAVLTEESKKKISLKLKKYFENNEISEATRKKISEANTGRKHDEETMKLLVQRAKNRVKFNCPHCDKKYDGGNLKQHMLRIGFSEEQIQNAKTL